MKENAWKLHGWKKLLTTDRQLIHILLLLQPFGFFFFLNICNLISSVATPVAAA